MKDICQTECYLFHRGLRLKWNKSTFYSLYDGEKKWSKQAPYFFWILFKKLYDHSVNLVSRLLLIFSEKENSNDRHKLSWRVETDSWRKAFRILSFKLLKWAIASNAAGWIVCWVTWNIFLLIVAVYYIKSSLGTLTEVEESAGTIFLYWEGELLIVTRRGTNEAVLMFSYFDKFLNFLHVPKPILSLLSCLKRVVIIAD